ncbi:MAG: right-handed parallel beta-helix repeat-containing protein [Desulfurococcaceae archaeon]|nr:right-handed parallel beta-helix repeat-containing protein [Desulfurococcaceae archaeon]
MSGILHSWPFEIDFNRAQIRSRIKETDILDLKSEASYIVFTEGLKYYAKNGDTGMIEFVDTDISNLLQNLINVLYQKYGGGRIFIKRGMYYPTKTVEIPDGISLIIEGEGSGTVFKYTQPFHLFFHSSPSRRWTSVLVFKNFKIDRTGSGSNNTDIIAVNYAKYVYFSGIYCIDDFRMASGNDACMITYNNIIAIAENNIVENKSYGIWMVGYLAIARGNYVKNTAYVGISANGFTPNFAVPPDFPDYGVGVVEDNVCIDCGQGDEAIAVDLGTTNMYPSMGIIRNNKVISQNATMRNAIAVIGVDKAVVEGNEVTGKVSEKIFMYNYLGKIVVRNNYIDVVGTNVVSSTGELIWLSGDLVTFNDNVINISYADAKNFYKAIEFKGNGIIRGNKIVVNAPSGYRISNALAIDFVVSQPNVVVAENVITGAIGNALLFTCNYVSDDHKIFIRGNVFGTRLSSAKALFFLLGNYSPKIYVEYFENIVLPPMLEATDMYYMNQVSPTFIIDADYRNIITWVGYGTKLYRRRNSGTATISAGSTRVTVNHGLVSTPTKFQITPLGQPLGKLWVENITSTSFDIVTDTAPTSDLNVSWYAEV